MLKRTILIFCLLGGLFFSAVPTPAKTLQKGVWLSDFYVGGGFGMENSGLRFENSTFAWGRVGVELGFSGFYFFNDYLGLGADFHYAGFQGTHRNFWDRSTTPISQYKMSLNTETWNLMAVGRTYVNPHSATRVYLPFGGGLVVGHTKFKYEDSFTSTYLKDSATSPDIGGFAGLGLEYDLYEGAMTIGLETRYNFYRYNIGRLADRIDADNRPHKKIYDYISVLMVVSFQ